MLEASARGALAGKFDEMITVKDRVYCQKCSSNRVYRVERKGFMQKKIYPLFGYFPWRCKSCGDQVMLRKRHKDADER